MTPVLHGQALPGVKPGAQWAPGWRPLAFLAAVVALAHVLVLQASPTRLGLPGSEADKADASSKTFATRSIEAPAPLVPAPAPAPAAVTAPAAVPVPRLIQNRPVAQLKRAQAAPESIAAAATSTNATNASAAPLTPLTPLTPSPPLELPPEISTAAVTPTLTVPVASTATSTATPIAVAAQTAPASGPATLPAAPTTSPVTAINLPASARLQYKVVGLSKSLNYQATAELLWKASGDKYEAALKVSAFLVGSRSMTSVGQITATGLAPTRFADKSKNELAAHFEAAQGKIVFSANTPDAPWVDGAQDRVSVFLQLGGILAARPADFPAGASVTIYTVGPREAEAWTFEVQAQETLDLLGAPMSTLKLIRKPRREFDQKIEVWYAPSLGYLPVRNRITQPSGDFVDQQLSEVSRS